VGRADQAHAVGCPDDSAVTGARIEWQCTSRTDEYSTALVPAHQRRQPRDRRFGRRFTSRCRPLRQHDKAAHHRLPRRDRPYRRASRLRVGADADGVVVRGRVDHHVGVESGHHSAQVPGGISPWVHLTHARRTPGRHLPAHLRWATAAEHRHRRGPGRAGPIRRPSQPRRPLSAHCRVPPGPSRNGCSPPSATNASGRHSRCSPGPSPLDNNG